MDVLEELKELGVDIEDGLKRLNKNEALYKRLLGTFVKTMKAKTIAPDFDASNCTEAIEIAHAIKGTAGNLSITPVYEAYSEIVNLLRTGQPEKAREILIEIIPTQNKIIQCIEKHSA
ncbi:MAG: Hpt domain-containing protein [Lachnospiraceae bacterium]|nr:Hpt domain-containing protein [Lachnospiraceae bacterium]